MRASNSRIARLISVAEFLAASDLEKQFLDIPAFRPHNRSIEKRRRGAATGPDDFPNFFAHNPLKSRVRPGKKFADRQEAPLKSLALFLKGKKADLAGAAREPLNGALYRPLWAQRRTPWIFAIGP
jgi:hypothetical protein